MPAIDLETLNKLFGFDTAPYLTSTLKKILGSKELEYSEINADKRLRILNELDQKLNSDTQKISSPQREQKWQNGWNHNLEKFKESQDISDLQPQYYSAPEKSVYNNTLKRETYVYRLFGEFIETNSPTFEIQFSAIFRRVIVEKFFKYATSFEEIAEFGCGSCLNIVQIIESYPLSRIHAIDFVSPPLAIAEILGNRYKVDIRTHKIDMRTMDSIPTSFHPNIIFTFGAIEQLGGRNGSGAWFNWLEKQSGSLVVLIEPTIENYDISSEEDQSAIAFHLKRDYSRGFIGRLYALEARGRLNWIYKQRVSFGSLFIEGYGVAVFQIL
jgi:hypothetical protein